MDLVTALTKQLNGKYTRLNSSYTFTFKNRERKNADS